MSIWIIEPRDPLIVRDGRPFGPNPGARAKSLLFPFPSTTTGGVRTRAGVENGMFDKNKIAEVKKIAVRGPLLVELDEAGQINNWLMPAPADALLFSVKDTDSKQVECHRLVPIQNYEGSLTNLPAKLNLLVGLTTPTPEKPFVNPPEFWYWEKIKEWLVEPQLEQTLDLSELGHRGPLPEQRMHVRIDTETQTGVDGFLFQTSGIEFSKPGDSHSVLPATRMALAVETEAKIAAGIAPLGGERRLMLWRQSTAETPWAEQPQDLGRKIAKAKACRLLLLTPAYFKKGYYPEQLLKPLNGVAPKLEAIALQHPQVVSGWDFTLNRGNNPGAPKPTRRLAPAGTVFFLKFGDSDSEADIEQWVNSMWMQCVSDEEPDNLASAGFGLAALGVWSGEAEPMKEAS